MISTTTTPQLTSPLATNTDRFSLFTLSAHPQGVVTSTTGHFDLRGYSRFKYGDSAETLKLARLLANKLIDTFGHDIASFHIAASPYKYVPSAAQNLLVATIASLVSQGYSPKGSFKIDRGVVKAVDYSTLSAAQRLLSNAGRNVTVPKTARLQIADQTVIIIDDIRVSGTTEKETRKALATAGVSKAYYCYISEIDQTNGHFNAEIEHAITHATITTLQELQELIVSDQTYQLNARTCKFILRADPDAVSIFAKHIPNSLYQQILHAVVVDGYHIMPEHAAAMAALVNARRELTK